MAIDHPHEAVLRRLGRGAPLSEAERRAVEGLPLRIRTLAPRSMIVHQGDPSDTCCAVLSGWVGCFKILAEGRRQILAFHIAGDLPGLQSLHLGTVDHGIAALTGATVALIPHAALHDLVERHPGVAARLWRETLVNVSILREWLTGLGRRSAYERIAHFLCETYLRQRAAGLAEDGRCPLPLTQTELADALGMTSVHVNRTLKDLRGSQLIAQEQRTIVIRDFARLSAAAEFDPTYLHLPPAPA